MSTGSQPEDRKFIVFSPLSIQSYAESIGIHELPENVMYELAKDASYRVREIISKSCQFMRLAKRKNLKASDVDKALYWSNVPPIIGAPQTHEFVQFGEVTYQLDSTVDLKDVVTSTISYPTSSPIKLSSEWVSPEDQPSCSHQDKEGI